MENDLKQKIDDLVHDGYNFRFGHYISESFNIFGKYAGGFIGFIFIYLIIVSFIGTIPILGQIANVVIGSPLIMGFYIVAHQIHRGETYQFSDFFKGFDHFGQLVLMIIAMYILIFLASIPFVIAIYPSGIFQAYMSENPTEILDALRNFPMWSLVLLIPIIYLSIAYTWANMFVVFYNVDFWTALESSRKIISKKWLIIFLFIIVISFIAILGVIGFFIGILITIPIAMIAIYLSFADVTGLNIEHENGDDLLDHLINTV